AARRASWRYFPADGACHHPRSSSRGVAPGLPRPSSCLPPKPPSPRRCATPAPTLCPGCRYISAPWAEPATSCRFRETRAITAAFLTTPRVERVAQPVAEEVEREHQEKDRQTRPHRDPGRLRDEMAGGVEHAAPARAGRLLAEPEKAETRLGDDRGGARQGRLHENRWNDVGQDVPQHDAVVGVSERARRLDVVLVLDRQHLAARQPGKNRRLRHADRD